MKKIICGIGLLAIFCGCANFLSTTANRGIAYGMSQESVIKVNEKKGCLESLITLKAASLNLV